MRHCMPLEVRRPGMGIIRNLGGFADIKRHLSPAMPL